MVLHREPLVVLWLMKRVWLLVRSEGEGLMKRVWLLVRSKGEGLMKRAGLFLGSEGEGLMNRVGLLLCSEVLLWLWYTVTTHSWEGEGGGVGG